MNRIDFLEQEINNVDMKIIELLQKEYANTGLEQTISDYRMNRLRGYMFMKDQLDEELRNEVEGDS